MLKQHHLMVVPGLGGTQIGFKYVVRSWKRFGFVTHVFDPNWRDGERFAPKLKRLVALIDELKKPTNLVSLVGTSAGGSAVINAYCVRKNKIHRMVNICGRLRAGSHVFPTLSHASRTSGAFKESVLLCEHKQRLLSSKDQKKIMTIRSLFDEVVPLSTMTLPYAQNTQIISVEHVVSIALAMTIYKKQMMLFLREKKVGLF